MLIPSRGPHLAPAPGPALPIPGVEAESQPACRRGRGSRVATGSVGGGTIRNTDGPAGGGKETRTAPPAPHRGATRGQPDDGAGGAEAPDGRGGRHHHLDPEGLLVLIPPGDLRTSASPPACRWEVGPDWSEDPHREATRGVGPVTGTAGSESQCGRGGRHHFRLKSRGPSLMLIPSKRALTFSAAGASPGLPPVTLWVDTVAARKPGGPIVGHLSVKSVAHLSPGGPRVTLGR